MRRLILAAALFPSVAFAQPAPPTVEMPSSVIVALQNFLLHPPVTSRIDPGDVLGFVETIQACVSVQVPVDGVIKDTGQCPAVSAAMHVRDTSQTNAVNAAVAKQKTEDAVKPAPKPPETSAPIPKP
jgi:hypothetical protein